MKKKILSILLLFLWGFTSCDDGKIYPEDNVNGAEGSTLKITAQISGVTSWPSSYSVVVAGFGDSDYAIISKGIPTPQIEGETVSVVLSGVTDKVETVELCVINSLRKRIATFYKTDFEVQTDTIYMNAGVVDAGIFNGIQQTVFNGYCTNCHGASISAAGGLYLTEGKSYAALVNKEAVSSPDGKLLVKPGDVENSFLLDVLQEGASRHYHTDILSGSPEKIDLLKSWIEGGAI